MYLKNHKDLKGHKDHKDHKDQFNHLFQKEDRLQQKREQKLRSKFNLN